MSSQPALLAALACGQPTTSQPLSTSDCQLKENSTVPSPATPTNTPIRPRRTPVWFMRQAGRSLPEYRKVRSGTTMMEACTNPELTCEITLQPVRRYGVDAAIFFSDIITPLNLAGVAVDIKPGVGPVFEEPVRTAADVERLVAHRDFDPTVITAAAQLVTLELPAQTPLIGFAGAPFTLAAYLIEGGPSKNYLRTRAFAHAQPQAWQRLAHWCAELSTQFLLAQVAGGAQAIQLFDSWVGNLSAADYYHYCLPHSQRIFQRLAAAGIPGIHFGVGTAHLLEALDSAQPAAIGVDWRIPLDQAAQRLRIHREKNINEGEASMSSERSPRGLVLQGNLDPAILSCPRELICQQVEQVLTAGLAADAQIMNLGHGVPPDTDPGVLAAIVEQVHAFDWRETAQKLAPADRITYR